VRLGKPRLGGRKIPDRQRPRDQKRENDPARVETDLQSHQFEKRNGSTKHGYPFLLRAACLACFDKELWDAARCGSRSSAALSAADRFADGFEPARFKSC